MGMSDPEFMRTVQSLLLARDLIADHSIDLPAQSVPSDYHSLALAVEQAERERDRALDAEMALKVAVTTLQKEVAHLRALLEQHGIEIP